MNNKGMNLVGTTLKWMLESTINPFSRNQPILFESTFWLHDGTNLCPLYRFIIFLCPLLNTADNSWALFGTIITVNSFLLLTDFMGIERLFLSIQIQIHGKKKYLNVFVSLSARMNVISVYCHDIRPLDMLNTLTVITHTIKTYQPASSPTSHK